MTAKIIRRRSESAGSIIEAAYGPFQVSVPKAANENARTARPGLSRQEAEIIRHLASGKGVVAVADLLKIDVSTVKEHIRSVARLVKTRTILLPFERPVGR